MSRRVLFIPAFFVLFIFACSRPDQTIQKSTADAGQPVQGDWAVVRFEAEPDSLNPLTSSTTVAAYALWGAKNSQIY